MSRIFVVMTSGTDLTTDRASFRSILKSHHNLVRSLQPKVAHKLRMCGGGVRPDCRPHAACHGVSRCVTLCHALSRSVTLCHALSRSVTLSGWKVWRPSWPLKLGGSTGLWGDGGTGYLWVRPRVTVCHALSRCVTLCHGVSRCHAWALSKRGSQ